MVWVEGKLLIVTLLATVTVEGGRLEVEKPAMVTEELAGKLETLTTWLAGKLETLTAAPTVTVTFSSAERLLASNATVTVLPTVTVAATELAMTG